MSNSLAAPGRQTIYGFHGYPAQKKRTTDALDPAIFPWARYKSITPAILGDILFIPWFQWLSCYTYKLRIFKEALLVIADQKIVSMLLLLTALTLFCCVSYNSSIKTFVHQNGLDSTSCWKESEPPCSSINLAFQGLQYTGDSTVIYLYPGSYTIEPGNETDLMKDMFNISIIGMGPADEVSVVCSSGVTLYNIQMKSVAIKQCSLVNGSVLFPMCMNVDTYHSDSGNLSLASKVDGSLLPTGSVSVPLSTYPGGKINLTNATIVLSDTVVCSLNETLRFKGDYECVDGKNFEEYPVIYKKNDYYSCNNFPTCIFDSIFSLQVYSLNDTIVSAQSVSIIHFKFDHCPEYFNVTYSDPNKKAIYDMCELETRLAKLFYCYSQDVIHGDGIRVNCTPDSSYYPRPGYCISHYHNSTIIGYCPATFGGAWYFSNWVSEFSFESLVGTNDIETCPDGTYGRLCGRCKANEGFRVPITSPLLECGDKDLIDMFYQYIVVEFTFLTMIVGFVILFALNFTTGSLNGYIFYCQIISVMFSFGYERVYADNDYIYILIVPSTFGYVFSNLDFPFSFFLDQGYFTSKIAAISFWYIISFYPLLLLLLLYVWIIMYHKGFKCVLCITRPMHKVLARFWRFFDIQPSFTKSLASVYILCFTRFAVTSVQLLQFTKWYSITGSYKKSGTAFYFDGTLDYFGQGHWPYGLLAIVVLLLVNILPVLFLLFYPFGWFHSLLSFCKLHKEGLIAVGDVFTGPFKHGGDSGTPDSRLLASYYLILRLIIVSLVGSFQNIGGIDNVLIIVLVLLLLSAGIIMMVKPFVKLIHNVVEFSLLIVIAFSLLLIKTNCLFGNFEFQTSTYITLAIIVSLPGLFATVYFSVKMFKKTCCKNAYCRYGRRIPKDYQEIPDRIENPELYDFCVNNA